jgi:predicted TPR repeat methyltransferase
MKGGMVGKSAPEVTISEAIEIAVGMHKAGNWESAEKIYERVLAAAPEEVDAHHFLGLSRYQRGLHQEGIDRLTRALELDPEHVEARNNLGNMLLERGRLDEAEAAYRRILAARPDHASAHANLGNVLRRRGDDRGAEAALRKALEINPEHGAAYHNLGSLLDDSGRTEEGLLAFQRALALLPYDGDSYRRVGASLAALGRRAEAEAVYRAWLKLEPGSPVAQHYFAACSGEGVPERASDGYVQETFDKFAASFDVVLERLEYRAPTLVAQAVAALRGAPAADLDVLDAGAGTGLCAVGLRPYARKLVGVDLSPGMLAKARERGGYDVLDVGELSAYMRERPGSFDLVVSADTLVYIGDLAAPVAAAAVTLRPGGHLVFTIEREDDEPSAGFRLDTHGRYRHGEGYVRRSLEEAGFQVAALEQVQLRQEARRPVEGMLVSAVKGTTRSAH